MCLGFAVIVHSEFLHSESLFIDYGHILKFSLRILNNILFRIEFSNLISKFENNLWRGFQSVKIPSL